MSKDNKEIPSADDSKIESTVLYVVHKYKELTGRDITLHALCKILYFADQKHLVKYGRPVIKDTYMAWTFGPVPLKVFNYIKAISNTR